MPIVRRTAVLEPNPPTQASSIIDRYLDFWLLGGASIAIWLVMKIGTFFRDDNPSVANRFMQIAVTFSLLSLICNHPHFMISYKFGYGRGARFIVRNWFSLIAVPVGLIALFICAYFAFDSDVRTSQFVASSNSFFETLGIGFRLGRQANLGTELLGVSIWAMYLTVGWHYSKQVFGCMMVYAKFDRYSISAVQKRILKGSVFSVAALQFTYLYCGPNSNMYPQATMATQASLLTPLSLPSWLFTASSVLAAVFLLASFVCVFAINFKRSRQLPSVNLLIPWLALYVWWVPFFQLPEFTMLMVPFFHSLQYLPFAYRVAAPDFKRDNWYQSKISFHVLALLLIGFFAFEGIPNSLDRYLNTANEQQPMFFITAFAIFINIHHFFIDSVVWRSRDNGMSALFRPHRAEQSPKMSESVTTQPEVLLRKA